MTTVYGTNRPASTVDSVGGLVAAATPAVEVVGGMLHIDGRAVHPCCLEDAGSGFCACPPLTVDDNPLPGVPAPLTTAITIRAGAR